MPAAAVTTITNVSKQAIPILVNAIVSTLANDASTIAASAANQLTIAPGAQVVIETQRIDLALLDQLRRKNLITYS